MNVERPEDKSAKHEELSPSNPIKMGPVTPASCVQDGETVSKTLHTTVGTCGSVGRKLLIEWQEVDRLLAKEEYAAALLVAAVNVEFILWETLCRLLPTSPPSEKPHYSEWKAWQAVERGDRDSVGLGSLIQLAQFFVDSKQLSLAPPLKPFGWPLNEARKGIAHERGYFARLTRLEEPDWAETRIRQVLEDARAFCLGNAPGM